MKKSLNLQIRRYQAGLDEAREHLIRSLKIDKVIDGGANIGQWADQLVKKYPHIRFYSYEPWLSAFEVLERKSKSANNWLVFNCGVGNVESEVEFHVASNFGMSSSVLEPSNHLLSFPSVVFEKTETVQIKRLDDFPELHGGRKYLKLDVQGSEYSALLGAEKLMTEVTAIEIEASFSPMYKGEKDFTDMLAYLKSIGFTPFHIFTPAIEVTGKSNYVDMILTSKN